MEARLITIHGVKYVAVETDKIPVVGSRSWKYTLNGDYPTVCDDVKENQADDGSTLYIAHYIRLSNGEDAGSIVWIKSENDRSD